MIKELALLFFLAAFLSMGSNKEILELLCILTREGKLLRWSLLPDMDIHWQWQHSRARRPPDERPGNLRPHNPGSIL